MSCDPASRWATATEKTPKWPGLLQPLLALPGLVEQLAAGNSQLLVGQLTANEISRDALTAFTAAQREKERERVRGVRPRNAQCTVGMEKLRPPKCNFHIITV